MNSIKDWMHYLLRTETTDTNTPRNTRFYLVIDSNTQQQSLMSHNHKRIMPIYRKVCRGYQNNGEKDKPKMH